MKKLLATLAAVGCLAGTLAVTATPADAYVVKKVIHNHRGPFGHGCRTVRTVKNGFRGRRVIVRHVCR